MVIEDLAGYRSLGWHFCSPIVCMTTTQDVLAFTVSVEKSGVILIGLSLPFSRTAFNILSLFYVFGVLIIMCQEGFIFWSKLFLSSVGFLYIHGYLFL